MIYLFIGLEEKMEDSMDKQNRMIAEQKNNVVSMALDANFFYERAMHHIDQHNYSKALKYLWKTIEYDSENPVHYCNIAGVLSEIGEYEKSSQLLLYVIEKLDPNMYECYFFLASNYTYLEDLESSYHYVKYYLEVDPSGDYVDEAKEMLEYLTFELEISEEQTDDSDNMQLLMWHRQAKRFIEEGKYYEAVKQLLKILEANPDFIAARNNLSLAYFYMGNVNKAIEQAKIAIEKEQTNVHAIANLVIYYNHLRDKNEYEYHLAILKKVVPIQREGLYKLSTTFGILGEHEYAYKYLRRVIREGIGDLMALHYGAIAALNTGRFDIALKWWNQLVNQNESKVALFYLEVLDWIRKHPDLQYPKFSYHHQIPIPEWLNKIEEDPDQFLYNPFFHFSLRLGLKYGDELIKERILVFLSFVEDKETEKILRELLLDEDQPFTLKKRALFLLEEMDVKPPYRMKNKNRIIEYGRLTPQKATWKSSWIQVLDILEEKMISKYNFLEIFQAKEIWYDFLSKTIPDTPQIRKPEGWSAAIEYIISHLQEVPMTIEQLSVDYQVSDLTILKNIKRIQVSLASHGQSKEMNQFN